jgi:hypothetical protein
MSNPDSSAETTENQITGIEFIDPLFGIAIGIGVTETFITQPFFLDWRLPAAAELPAILGWITVFIVTLLSWIGYRRSVRKNPVETFLRFCISIVLVMLYALMFVKYDTPSAIVQMFAWMFFLYLVWDLARAFEATKKEHPIKRWTFIFSKRWAFAFARNAWNSSFVTSWWLAAAAGLWLLYRWDVLGSAYLYIVMLSIAVGYRFHKRKFRSLLPRT